MGIRLQVLGRLLLLLLGACGHESGSFREATVPSEVQAAYNESEEGICIKSGSSTSARIWALIGQGQFAQAQALIAEARAAGLVAAPEATRMLNRINLLSTKLGQIHARLQKAPDFPSQLKDYTLFQLRQMLERKDFSLATHTQLKLAIKMIEQPDRLLQKASNMQR